MPRRSWVAHRHHPCGASCLASKRSRGRGALGPASKRLGLEVLEQRRLLAIDAFAAPSWVAQGPAPQADGYALGLADSAGNLNPVAGAVQAIAVNPANTNEVYVGTVNGGIWKSENAKNANIHWTPQTDAFSSLSITALAFDPSDSSHDTLYAGTGTTSSAAVGEGDVGLLRTTDGGTHWQLISKWFFQDPGRIESIVPLINPTTGTTRLLVGTDNYSAGGNAQAGVLYSDDPLDPAPKFSFVSAAQLPRRSVTDLVSDPTHPQQLYVALYGQGIYQSPDAGNTWTPVTTGIAAADLTGATAIKLAVSAAGASGLPAGSSSPVYAATLNQVAGAKFIQYQVTDVYSSTDAGTHWVVMAAPPAPLATDAFVPSPDFYSHFSMAADPNNNALVYISGAPQKDAASGSYYGTILLGNVGNRAAGAGNWTSVVEQNASANLIDPNSPNPTAPHPDSRRMIFDITGQLWEADDGGLYRLIAPSDNTLNAAGTGSANRRWVAANGDLQITEFNSVAYDPNHQVILGGAQDNDVSAQTAPGATTWRKIQGGDGEIVQAQTATLNNQSVTYEYSSLFNLGRFTQRIVLPDGSVQTSNPPLALNVPGPNAGASLSTAVDASIKFTTPFVVDLLDANRLLIGTARLYESFDGGKTLADITATITGGGPLPANISALAYGGRVPAPGSPSGFTSDPDLAYVAAGSSLFVRTTANGAFTRTSYALAGSASSAAGAIKDIVLDPDDDRTAYILDANNHVWRTTDRGTTWTDLTENLSLPKNLSLDTIELVKHNGNAALLVGGGGGVYRTLLPTAAPLPGLPPREIVWTKYGQGLPNAIVTDLHYDSIADSLVVGTWGRGAWMMPNVSATIFQDPVIHVVVSDATNNVLIRRDGDHPERIDVFVSSATTPDLSVHVADVRQIVVTNLGGPTTLTVDSTNGPVSVLDGISFEGGSATNTLVLAGPAPDQKNIPQPNASGSGSAALVANDPLGFGPQLEDVAYSGVQTVSDGLTPPLAAQMTALGNGLRKTADLLRHQNALSTQVASLGGSLGSALEGATATAGQPDADGASADPDVQPVADPGDSLLSRLLESGANRLNLGAIEDVAEVGSIASPQVLLTALNALGTATLVQNGDTTLYDFRMTKNLTGQASLDVLDQALGGTVQLSGDLSLSADVALHLQFGVDDDGFFIEPNGAGDPLFTVSNIQVDGGISGAGRLGILGVELTDGTIAIDPAVKLQLSLTSPANVEPDGLLRLSDLAGEGDALLTASLTGGASQKDVVLDGTFSIAAMELGLPKPFSLASAEVALTWPDITNPAAFTVTAQATAGKDLLNFLHGTPQVIVGGLNKIGNFLDEFRSKPVFATQIPFTHGTTLGQVLDYGDALRKKATALLSAADGTASFSTVQDLAVNLAAELDIDPSKLGMQYDPLTQSLSYQVAFSQTLDPLALPVDFSVHAGTLASFSTTSQLTITPRVDVSFDVGLDLSSLITGDNLTQDFFLSNARLDGSVTAADNNFDATAQIGSISLHVTGGTLSATGALALGLVDPVTETAAGRLTLDELANALSDPSSIIGDSSITAGGGFHLPVTADPFLLGGATVALAGLVSGTDSTIDYTMSAGLSGELLPGLSFESLPTGQPSQVVFNKANGMTLDARLAIDGVQLMVTGAITPSDDFSVHATADPFALGGLTVALDGDIVRTAGVVDYSLKANVTGTLLPGLDIEDESPGVPTVTLTSKNGLALAARASAFGVRFNVTGQFQATDDFHLQVATDPFNIPGGGTVNLAGSIFRDANRLNWLLAGDVRNWQPVPFLTVADLAVALNLGGLTFDATTDIAGVNGIHLHGDYDFSSGSYLLTATAPVDWHLMDGVDLTNVVFAIGNRNADGSAGDTTVGASANVNLFDTPFTVAAHVTSAGSWIAATPADPESFKPVPGLTLSDEYVVASSYDFVFDLDRLNEAANPPTPLTPRERQIDTGINLVASSQLPAGVPAIGGDEIEVQGVIGTSLSAMSIEAKIVLTQPWVLAGVVEFDALGLRITGQPSLTVFGDGKILHDKIPGLGQDIGVEAGLTLTATGLDGSLSLLSPVDNIFGVNGLNIVQANVSVGITFGDPLPVVGFNFTVDVPQPLVDLLDVPPEISAALKTDPAQPIFSMTVDDWRPFHALGIDSISVQHGSLIVAPFGGTIGTKTFQPGVTAAFDANILGTTVSFQGLLNQQTKGVLLEAYVSQFSLGGVMVTGPGPNGQLGDADDGAYFRAAFTPDEKQFSFASLLDLPSAKPSGPRQTAELDGQLSGQGMSLNGTISHWQPLGAGVVDFNGSLKADISFQTTSLNLDFDASTQVLGSNVEFVGSLFASNRQFDLFAATTIGLSLPGGPHRADLAATIDVGKNTPFSIALAGDLPLPGSRPAVVQLAGALGADGVHIAADVNHWQLVPGLSFDGAAKLDADLKANTVAVNLDVNADIIGSNLNLHGQVVAGGNGLGLNLTGHVDFVGKQVGFAHLSLDATVITTSDASGGRRFALSFDGDLSILNAFDFRAHAGLSVTPSGDFKFTATVFVDAGLDAQGNPKPIRLVDLDVGVARITVDFQASATISFGTNLDDFSLSVAGDLDARAHMHISGISDPHVHLGFGPVDIDLGQITIPKAQIVIDYQKVGGYKVATGFHLADLHVPWGQPADPTTTVTATRVVEAPVGFAPSGGNLAFALPGGGPAIHLPSLVEITGIDAPQRVKIDEVQQLQVGPNNVPVLVDTHQIAVSGADGGGELVPLLTTTTDDLQRIDIDLPGGNSQVDISPLVTVPVSIRASGGGDVIQAGGGPALIDASPATTASAGPATAVNLPGGILGVKLPPFVPPHALPTDRGNTIVGGRGNDTIVGGVGNDVITGGGGVDSISGGGGIDVINGVLAWQGGDAPEHLEVFRQFAAAPGSASTAASAGDNIVLRLVNRLGTGATLVSVPTSALTGISLDGGAGNDDLDVSPIIKLPTTISGGSGDDTIQGGAGPNEIHGGDGNDVLFGGAGNDSIFGEEGDDLLVGNGGVDVLDGGPGQNQILDQSAPPQPGQPQPPTVAPVADQTVEVGHLLSFSVTASQAASSGPPSPPGPTETTVFSAAGDFSATQNPEGAWSYGWSSTPGGAFNLDAPAGGTGGVERWFAPISELNPPEISFNSTSAPAQDLSSTLRPGQLALHAGLGSQSIVVRWTAPADGTYVIDGGFAALNTAGNDVYVLDDSGAPTEAQLFTGAVSNTGDTQRFLLLAIVKAGDHIDFTVSHGDHDSRFNNFGDDVAIEATITPLANKAYSAAAEFSATQNPTGPWSYGWSPALGGTFNLYPHEDGGSSGIEAWNEPSILQLGAPSVIYNPTDTVLSPAGSNIFQPHRLGFHPGANGEYSIVRWTAPAAGSYVVTGSFSGIDSTTTDVHVLDDSGGLEENALFSGEINGFGDTRPFSLTVTANAGDHIDFTVGNGGNGFFSDSTAIDATVTPLAPPPPPLPPPPQKLTYSLDPGAPAGAAIDPESGLFTWTPTAEQGPATYTVGVRVTGDGTPPLSDVQSITIAVTAAGLTPTLAPIADQTATQFDLVSLVASATDEQPNAVLTFSLANAPPGAQIDPVTGAFQWRPDATDLPGNYPIIVRVSDNGNPPSTATTTFNIEVAAYSPPPVNQPSTGQVSTDASGGVSFQTSANFDQVDSFNFTIADSLGRTDVGSARFVSPQFFQASKLYDSVLNRPASDAEVKYWAGKLVAPGGLTDVATSFLDSDEHRSAVVTLIYQQFLGRAPDAQGLQGWVGLMRAGMTAELVQAHILSSDEFFREHGGSNAGFVQGLYQDLFARTPSAAEATFWQSALNQGVSRFTFARGFLASSEYQGQLIRQFYADYLGRQVDQPSLTYWMGQLAAGVSTESVQVAILASHEFAGLGRAG